jgi:acyl-lipid omega-6 desaturase (Delta-12 desaturase)
MPQVPFQPAAAPSFESLSHLRARDSAGWTVTSTVTAVTVSGLWLSWNEWFWVWAGGQVVLALALLQWFVILHEAGHNNLFRTCRLNRLAGHVASVFALIPFYSWQRIHARHHKYTGWQDLDATTALLVPRAIKPWERAAMNFSWATGLPLFSILYRMQNFWNLPRVARYLERADEVRAARLNAWSLGLLYALGTAVIGPATLLTVAGAAFLLSLMAQDLILLSQHTHMPSNLSHGAPVRPFPPQQQEQFTRSLRLPEWLSRFLLRFDMHELHHMYVQVPGYDLHRIPYAAQNEVNWLDWTREAKQLSGTAFLFGSREQTGFRR